MPGHNPAEYETPTRARNLLRRSGIDVLQREKIRISMDGRGAWRDNVFIERLWKSVKYEEVYLHAYDSVAAAKAGIGDIFCSTMAGVLTRRLTAIHLTTFTSTLSRSRRLHNPRSSTYPDREICLNLWGHLSVSDLILPSAVSSRRRLMRIWKRSSASLMRSDRASRATEGNTATCSAARPFAATRSPSRARQHRMPLRMSA